MTDDHPSGRWRSLLPLPPHQPTGASELLKIRRGDGGLVYWLAI
jgi:hypothetical protein